MESTNNISFVALQSGRAFIGTYDNVVGFCSATISFYADTTTTITLFQSQNKTADYGTVFNTVANTQFIQNVNLSAPYAYFIVRNNSVNDQTVLRFTVIYNMPYAPSSGGGVGTDVNILSQEADLATQTGLTTINNSINSKATFTLWNNVAVASLGVSESSSGSPNARVISIYGNTSVPTTLTIQFSPDNSAGSYFSSQYNIMADGDFGYSLPCAFANLRLISSEASTIKAYITYN